VRIAIVNPVSQTSPNRWNVPPVVSNAQSIGVQLAREIAATGNEVTVVMAQPFRPATSDEGVDARYLPVVGSPVSPSAQLPLMPSLRREIATGGFDAVVSSELFQWSTLALAEKGLPPLFVWHEADTYQQFLRTVPARLYYATAAKRVIRRAAGFFPRGDSAREFLLRVGVPAEKIGPEVPNGINARLFAPSRESRAETPLILFVGSLIERKNPSLAVHAMPYVLRKVPEAKLLMKGFGDQEGHLRALVGKLGVEGAVGFDTSRSTHSEMVKLYNHAWVCVFPTFRDFATLSPIEAVACGVPVVLSKRLFSARYLEDMGCAVATSDDPAEFAEGILRQFDSRGRSGLPDATLAPVVDRFSLQNAAGSLVDYVGEVIGR
jgi:glycosyltransferase involved in cell wall biosynthesis